MEDRRTVLRVRASAGECSGPALHKAADACARYCIETIQPNIVVIQVSWHAKQLSNIQTTDHQVAVHDHSGTNAIVFVFKKF